MIYPKDILDFVAGEKDLRERFPNISGISRLNTSDNHWIDERHTFEKWMLSEGLERSSAVRRHVFFLTLMKRTFESIESVFPKSNPCGRDGCDQQTISTSVNDMLCIARYLYYLDSYQVPGCLLECGCFKGWSSCCLSWACHFLGRKLMVADSFNGLPSQTDQSWIGYQSGDFKGDFEEVVQNVALFGKPDNVEFIRGWFAESLQDFNEPICLLWMDVDLHQSAHDVLNNVFNRLSPGGVIFSHEYDQAFLNPPIGPPAAIFDFLRNHNVKYSAASATGEFLGLIVPYSDGEILYQSSRQNIWNMIGDRELIDIEKHQRVVTERQRLLEDHQRMNEEEQRINEEEQRMLLERQRMAMEHQRINEEEQRINEDLQRTLAERKSFLEDQEKFIRMLQRPSATLMKIPGFRRLIRFLSPNSPRK